LDRTATSRLDSWQKFYKSIKDPSWPDCDSEEKFNDLPQRIKKECQELHGYVPNEYQSQSPLQQKRFPIYTETACQLKWTWSTVFLTTGTTASCHRTNQHRFDTEVFDFHNTPEKIDDRKAMLQGQWPKKGCEYCRDIEDSNGQSDRITNLDMDGIHAPPELDQDVNAVSVTPRILEVYFDNTCNLKCLYCGPYFSSLWDAENKAHGTFSKNGLTISDSFSKSIDIETNKEKLFQWLKTNRHHLTNFNILGGEPLYQKEFDQCLELFDKFPSPSLNLQIFTNLKTSESRLHQMIDSVKNLVSQKKIQQFTVTASLDCWGEQQEYVRYPLKLDSWQKNFEILLEQSWINLIIGSTITPLTVKTLPHLIEKINHWNKLRPVYHYFNSVNSPSYMFIDIFGDIFRDDFDSALDLIPETNDHDKNIKQYLSGIAKQSARCKIPKVSEVLKLKTFLDEMDRRRHTNWHKVFPWLEKEFDRILPMVDQ
jgi:hypothetical protein